MTSEFVHLHNHSDYSLLDGAQKIDQLVNTIDDLNMDAVALTEHGNMFSVLPYYKQAKKAAQYCLAAREQGKFKEMYRMIFDNYKNLKNNEDLPLDFAAELGLDKEKLKADANSPKIIGLIDEEMKQMRNSGIPRLSVPKFLINGKEPQGRSIEAWSAIIDAELKKK